MTVIANTTIISNFASVGRLDILKDLLGQLYITTEVYAEIQEGAALLERCHVPRPCHAARAKPLPEQ